MEERVNLLAAISEAVAGGQWQELEWLVKAAYSAGATRDDPVRAVEVGGMRGNLSDHLLILAYATVNAWQWMALRRPTGMRKRMRWRA